MCIVNIIPLPHPRSYYVVSPNQPGAVVPSKNTTTQPPFSNNLVQENHFRSLDRRKILFSITSTYTSQYDINWESVQIAYNKATNSTLSVETIKNSYEKYINLTLTPIPKHPCNTTIQDIVRQYLIKESYWTDQKENLLQSIVSTSRPKTWYDITHQYQQKTGDIITAHELYVRFRGILTNSKPGYKPKSPWDECATDMIQKLVAPYVKNQETIRWKNLTEQLNKKTHGTFTPKQVRERYINYLDPSLDWSPFEKKEKIKILTYTQTHGAHWAKITQLLEKKRSEYSIKNWLTCFINLLQKNSHEIPYQPAKTLLTADTISFDAFEKTPLSPLFKELEPSPIPQSLSLFEESCSSK